MTLGAAIVLLVVGATGTGCTVCRHAKRTTLDEPSEFSARRDRGRSLDVYRQWAAVEWERRTANCAGAVNSPEFGAGFQDGFVDYVFAGGTGNPPPVPPRKFWNVAWRNPDGHAASQDWFAGYRAGVEAARAGGYREMALVQSSYEFAEYAPASHPPELSPYLPGVETLPNAEMLPTPAAESVPVEPAAPEEQPSIERDGEPLPLEPQPELKPQPQQSPTLPAPDAEEEAPLEAVLPDRAAAVGATVLDDGFADPSPGEGVIVAPANSVRLVR